VNSKLVAGILAASLVILGVSGAANSAFANGPTPTPTPGGGATAGQRLAPMTAAALALPVVGHARMLGDISPGVGNGVSSTNYAKVGSYVLFYATDATHGSELWESRGTASTTRIVKDIDPGMGGSYAGQFVSKLVTMGSYAYFGAIDSHGSQLWRSNGTAAGTTLVDVINPSGDALPSNLTVIGSTLYFFATDGVHGSELWKTDGTAADTELVRDINPGTSGSLRYSSDVPVVVGNSMYFVATDGTHGYEPWVTNGTFIGTRMIADINPGSADSYDTNLTAFNGQVFFDAYDGSTGSELWVTDGTTAGRLADINPGSPSGAPSNLTVAGKYVYFSANDGVNGYQLWRTDGTQGGTQIAAIPNPSGDSNPSEFVANGSYIYFIATDGTSNNELWRDAGTPASAVLVKEFGPSGLPQGTYAARGLVFVSAYDATHGDELWYTNGTTSGTHLVGDINPGVDSSSPTSFFANGTTLYFTATRDTYGTEPWVFII
jgi:ELWxxDGT repeat protein